MTILGIDLSTRHIDIAHLDIDTLQATWAPVPLDYRPGSHDAAFHAAASVRARLTDYGINRTALLEDGVTLVAVEAPRGRQLNACAALYRIQGAIVAHLAGINDSGRPVLWQLPPWEWRQACGLPGNAPKHDVAAWAVAEGCPDGWPQDAYDAYAIARAAAAINERAAA